MKRFCKPGLALLATALWLWFIYARSAQPAAVSHEESGAVLGLLRKVLPFVDMLLVRKLAHFTEYAVLGALLWLDWRLLGRDGLLLPLGAGLLFAAGDELLQTFIPGRSGELLDVLLDFSGVLAAVLPARLIRKRKENKRREA
ncbi:MAG: VanZ family protein [Oscillospiraceae bacterium]|nr:VanZ family protein [Oscillospiraceae bacterium]